MRNKVNVEKESLDWSILDARVELLKKNTAKVKKETEELEKEYNSLISFVRSFKPKS